MKQEGKGQVAVSLVENLPSSVAKGKAVLLVLVYKVLASFVRCRTIQNEGEVEEMFVCVRRSE